MPKSKLSPHHQLFQQIVDAPFEDKFQATNLDLGIVVLLLVDHSAETIDRIALSNTEQALGAVRMSEKKFHEIRIPLHHKTNTLSVALQTQKPQHTDDWYFLFTPVLSAQSARFNQTGAAIACSFVYPLDNGKGALIFSYYQPFIFIKPKHRKYMKQYAAQVSNQLADLQYPE